MFSLCISDEKKFQHSSKGLITAVPVFVEFGKIYPLEGSELTDRSIKDHDAGMELLHTVASLYYKHLHHLPLNIIYQTLCREGVKTLLLLRHGEEILREWKEELGKKRSDETKDLDCNPLPRNKASTDEKLSPEDYSSDRYTFPCQEFSSPSFEELSITSSCSKTFSSGVISDLEDDSEKIISSNDPQTEDQPQFQSKLNDKKSTSEKKRRNGKKSSIDSDRSCKNLQAKIEHCFEDEFFDKLPRDEENEEINERFQKLLESAEVFIDKVNQRRELRDSIESSDDLDINHVSTEHRIIASVTFHKDYRFPSINLLILDWIIVRSSYRSSKIGQYLIKKIKSSSLVGTYHLMAVNASSQSIQFFRKNNFIEDEISESRMRSILGDNCCDSKMLFYFPSYRSGQIPLYGSFPWENHLNDLSMKSISEDIDFWRERSLESYHEQVCLILRLKQEIFKLHNLLRSKDKQLKEVDQENKELRHIITQSNALAAITAIDELGTFFESIKDLCSVLR